MFEESSVMIIAAGVFPDKIYRVEVDADTQATICCAFANAKDDLISGKSRYVFDGSYKPHSDEFLAIEQFILPDEIKDAIRDPLGVPAFQEENGRFPDIKAVFVGERTETEAAEQFNVAFQRFRKEQYISMKWYNLFFGNNTFFQEKRYGISISDNIDCYYTNGELQFTSFYFARQIFDLSEYYRSATDQEVNAFASNRKLLFADAEAFRGMANTWIRRKIAMINDSKVFENYPAQDIQARAAEAGITIDVSEDKIKIPNDKEQVKIILGFLDEEAYKGPFSQFVYLAGSKRKVYS